MLRAIREVKPKWVIGENVFGLINWDGGLVHHEVQADLEAEGYEVFSVVLPAASVGAPHRRDRVWFVAHSKRDANGLRTEGRMEMDRDVLDRRKRQEKANRFNHKRKDATNANSNGQQRSNGEHEINSSKRRFNALDDVEQVVMLPTHCSTDSKGGATAESYETRGRTETNDLKTWAAFQERSGKTSSCTCPGDTGVLHDCERACSGLILDTSQSRRICRAQVYR